VPLVTLTYHRLGVAVETICAAVARIGSGMPTCQAYRQQHGCDFISAMPTNLCGPGDNFDLESAHVLPAIMRRFQAAAFGGEPVPKGVASRYPLPFEALRPRTLERISSVRFKLSPRCHWSAGPMGELTAPSSVRGIAAGLDKTPNFPSVACVAAP
jgi:hypothetical protein